MKKGRLVNVKGYAGYINEYLVIGSTAYQFRKANGGFAYFGDWDALVKISNSRRYREFETSFVSSNRYQTWYEKLGVIKVI